MNNTNEYSSNSLPPRDVVFDVVQQYFTYCHRQPLWLFDDNDMSSLLRCSEELLFSLLSLAARYSSHAYFDGQHQIFAHKYGEIARGLVMFRIAQGTVTLPTIQSLCLLALANFVGQLFYRGIGVTGLTLRSVRHVSGVATYRPCELSNPKLKHGR